MTATGVIHGRFQVVHNDHLAYLLAGKARCERLIVGVTNPDPTLTRGEESDIHRGLPEANPLTYLERHDLIRRVLTDAGVGLETFSVVPFPINVPDLYRHYVPLDAVFYLTIYDSWGREKRARFRSLGLHVEVLWEKPLEEKGIEASEVRRRMRERLEWEEWVPAGAAALMKAWNIPARLRDAAENG